MKKNMILISSAALLILTIGMLYYLFFSYNLIQGEQSEICYIVITKQNADGGYSEIQITDSTQVKQIYELIVDASNGKVSQLFLMPSHEYSKDSIFVFEIQYNDSVQNIYIGYDDMIIFDLEPKYGSTDRGFAYLHSPAREKLIAIAEKLVW